MSEQSTVRPCIQAVLDDPNVGLDEILSLAEGAAIKSCIQFQKTPLLPFLSLTQQRVAEARMWESRARMKFQEMSKPRIETLGLVQ